MQLAYRVVQEGVTNAMRYAAGSSVTVTVRGAAHGLRGLRDRLGACGGTLDAGPTADGGWRVAARLPRRATADVA